MTLIQKTIVIIQCPDKGQDDIKENEQKSQIIEIDSWGGGDFKYWCYQTKIKQNYKTYIYCV